VRVESGLTDLCSCATPVVPELRGKGRQKTTPSLKSSTVALRSMHTPARDDRCSSRRSSPPSLVLLPPTGVGKKKYLSLARCLVGAHASMPSFFSCPLSFVIYFSPHVRSRCGRPYPPLVVYVVREAPIRACAHCMRQPIDTWVPTRGGVGRTHGSGRRSTKGTEINFEDPPYLVFPAAGDHVDLRCHTVTLLRLRPSTGIRSLSPRPHGRYESHTGGRQRASALLRCCFPAVRRQLQRPPPTHIRPYPRHRKTTHAIQIPPVDMRVCKEYLALKRNIGLAEREILTKVY
jgi:hypothetical protein